jgi:hypothetical protein
MRDGTATLRRLLVEWLDTGIPAGDLTQRTLDALAVPRDLLIVEAELAYERALAHPRAEGLEVAGARLARLYAEARRGTAVAA